MKKTIISFSIAAALLASCEKTVTVNIPEKAPRLVVNSLMTTGEQFSATIGRSRHILHPVNQTEAYIVKDAIPVVFENNAPVDTLYYHQGSLSYQGDHVVQPGRTYEIRVAAPGFGAASASSDVPSQSQIAELTRIRNAKTNSGGESMDEIILKIDDPAGERNFYHVQVFHASYGAGPGYVVGCVNTTDKDIEQIGEYADPFSNENCYDGGKLLMSDANFNGRQKIARFFVRSQDLQDYPGPGGLTNRPYVTVSRITEAEFKYIKSYEVYYSASGNPFAEPVNVFSNVQNGYGIFAISTIVADTLR